MANAENLPSARWAAVKCVLTRRPPSSSRRRHTLGRIRASGLTLLGALNCCSLTGGFCRRDGRCAGGSSSGRSPRYGSLEPKGFPVTLAEPTLFDSRGLYSSSHAASVQGRTMTIQKSALERAFEIARTGAYDAVADIRRQLNREGFDARQLEGRTLARQLLDASRAARQNKKAASEIR